MEGGAFKITRAENITMEATKEQPETTSYSQSGAIRTARSVSKPWNVPKSTRKAKVARLLESSDLAWILSARSAELACSAALGQQGSELDLRATCTVF